MHAASVMAERRPLRVIWDTIVIVAIFIAAAMTLYNFTFGDFSFDRIYWAFTTVFALDLLINLFVKPGEKHRLIHESGSPEVPYLRGWFLVDVVAAFPFAYFLSLVGDIATNTLLLDLVIFARFLPFLKMLKLPNLFRKLETTLLLNHSEMRLFTFAFWFLFLVHLMSLGWITIGAGEEFGGVGFHQYLLAVYWTLATIATIGYGDITPDLADNIQIGYTIVIELAGVGIFGYVIGNIASFVSEIDRSRRKFNRRSEEINNFLRDRALPLGIQEKVRDYRNYLWNLRKTARLESVFREMPESLHVDILLHLNKDIIQRASLFKEEDEVFVRDLVQLLESEVYLPEDYVIREGEYGDCMYFLSKGEVEIVAGGRSIAKLDAGSPFGESALVSNEKRNASVRCLSYCEVFKLPRVKFDVLRGHYPEFDARLKNMAAERLRDTAKKLGPNS